MAFHLLACVCIESMCTSVCASYGENGRGCHTRSCWFKIRPGLSEACKGSTLYLSASFLFLSLSLSCSLTCSPFFFRKFLCNRICQHHRCKMSCKRSGQEEVQLSSLDGADGSYGVWSECVFMQACRDASRRNYACFCECVCVKSHWGLGHF